MTTSTLSRTCIPTGTWRLTRPSGVSGSRSSRWASLPCAARSASSTALEIGEDLADSRIHGRVDAASVDTNQSRRDEHLRSPDFPSAESHPELSFRSKGTEPVDEDSFRVIGDLSINGVTNEVELTAELGGIETGPDGEERIGLEVTGEVSRKALVGSRRPARRCACLRPRCRS
jgi:YceI-like domain